jgi:DNA-binding NarL/FixJ family response regulator
MITRVGDAPISIIIIDDHSLFCRGLELLLASVPDNRVQVAAWTDDPARGLEIVRRNRPQIAVVDLTMPPPGGLAVIRDIKRNHPEVRVLALSGTDDARHALDALEAGADGFLPKSSSPEALVPPLVTMAEHSVLPTSLLRMLVGALTRSGRSALERLTPEEVELWRLIARGLDSTDIATHLFVSERTAKRMVASLLGKIGAANRVEAAALAGRSGLLDQLDD